MQQQVSTVQYCMYCTIRCTVRYGNCTVTYRYHTWYHTGTYYPTVPYCTVPILAPLVLDVHVRYGTATFTVQHQYSYLHFNFQYCTLSHPFTCYLLQVPVHHHVLLITFWIRKKNSKVPVKLQCTKNSEKSSFD